MDRKQLEEIFEDATTNWNGDNAWQGLKILEKYCENDIITYAAHEVIYSANIDFALKNGLTKIEAKELARLNWMLGSDEDDEHFACFV